MQEKVRCVVEFVQVLALTFGLVVRHSASYYTMLSSRLSEHNMCMFFEGF